MLVVRMKFSLNKRVRTVFLEIEKHCCTGKSLDVCIFARFKVGEVMPLSSFSNFKLEMSPYWKELCRAPKRVEP